MGYQWVVTDTTDHHALNHLTAAEARLSAFLARPKAIALACVVVVTAMGWLALASMATTGWDAWQALCRPLHGGSWSDFVVTLPMWVAMVLAMMLPTAGPMILTYAEIADTAASKHEPVVSPLVLTAGYVTVWIGFAAAAATLQGLLARFGVIEAGGAGRLLSGVLFVAAGLYQFSALKQSCLAKCQRPFPFFFANWTEQPAGVFRLGLRQGLYCLGCCWAMMLVMFAAGAMNVVWMAVLGVLMTIEKLSTTARFRRAVGAGFIVIGLVMVAWSAG